MPRPDNGNTPPAMAKPSRQQPLQEAPRRVPRSAGIVASMSEPPGRVSTRPAGRWMRALASRRCGRALYPSSVATRKMVARRARPQSGATEGNLRTKQQGSKPLDPGFAGATNRARNAAPETKATHAAGNSEAEPAATFPLLDSAECSPRPAGIVASMFEPSPGRVSTRPAGRGWSERHRRAGAAAGGVFIHLSCRHKKDGRPAGRDPANHRQPKATREPNSKGSKALDPGLRRATNRARMPCPKRRFYTPPAMAKPSRQQPSLLQRRVQPAAGGNCRVDV